MLPAQTQMTYGVQKTVVPTGAEMIPMPPTDGLCRAGIDDPEAGRRGAADPDGHRGGGAAVRCGSATRAAGDGGIAQDP